jgi:hypothetical protein
VPEDVHRKLDFDAPGDLLSTAVVDSVVHCTVPVPKGTKKKA